MEAYHLKTSEPDSLDGAGLEYFDLYSIYIPEAKILVGYVANWLSMDGRIVNYSNTSLNRAQDIVDGSKNGVRGEVLFRMDLDHGVIDRIVSNSNKSEIKITEEYNCSTGQLIKILSGELISEPVKRKGLFAKFFG